MQSVKFVNHDQNRNHFYQTLLQRVNQYFKENNISRYNNKQMIIKSVVLLGFYIVPFLLLLILAPSFSVSLIFWSVMGVALAGVGMSVMHDAIHGSYSKSNKINYWMGNTLNLLGGSVFNWKVQHNVLHHTYTNITHMDEDIEDKLVLRFSPHTPVKWFHRYQFVYAFLFYGVLTLYWVVGKDFVQFFRYLKTPVNTNNNKQNTITFIKIVLVKIFYLSVFFALPVFVFEFSFLEVLTGFLIMQFIAGLILTVVFQLAHTVEHTSHPLPNEEGNIENTWAIHQMNTTVNFSRKNKLLSWYVGGLNYQVEHHLFPNICHVHYPAISEIVKSTAGEFNVPYLENPTLLSAVASHIRLLKQYGTQIA
jgi:linoleoyl-CoA desaturase